MHAIDCFRKDFRTLLGFLNFYFLNNDQGLKTNGGQEDCNLLSQTAECNNQEEEESK